MSKTQKKYFIFYLRDPRRSIAYPATMNVLDTYENGEKTEVQVFLLSLSLSLGFLLTPP